ncbi:MAG: DUF4129 domain-containing protein [Microthrixaceae bacterium]|nr:DUF4129 domain-containing protein [Microthrixaceae bacterium]
MIPTWVLSLIVTSTGALRAVLVRGIGMVLQSDQDPERVRAQIEEILGRSEFSYEKSLLRRFFDWLGSLLRRILPSPNIQMGTPASGPGLWSVLISVLLIAGAVAVIVMAVLKFRRRASRQDTDHDESVEVNVRANDPDSEWIDEALNLESAGDWKGSVLVRYRRLVNELMERKVLESTPGLTPGELGRDLGEADPRAGALFGEATVIFEDPWYGDLPTSAVEVERLGSLTEQILEGVAPEAGSGSDKGTNK